MARKSNSDNPICEMCGHRTGKNGLQCGKQKYVCRRHKPSYTFVEGDRPLGGQRKESLNSSSKKDSGVPLLV